MSTGEQNKHARRQHRLVGARSTGSIRSSGPSTQAMPIERIVDRVIKEWKEATQGSPAIIAYSAAEQLSILFGETAALQAKEASSARTTA